MFDLHDLHAYYGKSHIVQGISLSVGKGEAVALVGRNGVGKTTTLKAIMGMVGRTEGRVQLNGESLGRMSSHARARKGLGYVPEERAVFPTMTVEENIRIGALLHGGAEQAGFLREAYSLFPILQERRLQAAGTLSGGQQKMLSLARGLAMRPTLLLIDEPSEGLMPLNVELVTDAIVHATSSGLSVLVVDASFDLLRRACSRLYVMDRGLLVGTYQPEEFRNPDELAATYLGART
jgi:ABC-type branched-subunit amino acid transport system ATPase component